MVNFSAFRLKNNSRTAPLRFSFLRFKDGEEMYSDSRIKISRDAKRIENYHLTITLVRSEDGGEYEVRATNEMGTAVTKSLVTVLGKNGQLAFLSHTILHSFSIYVYTGSLICYATRSRNSI